MSFHNTRPITSARMPPMMKSARHPLVGMTSAASSPASAPPSGMHTIVAVTAKARRRIGTYSAASVAAFGMAPPSPIPARSRSTLRASIDPTSAIMHVSAPNRATQPMSVGRRPKRSPARPPRRPPTIMPKGPTANANVKSARWRPHSRIMAGTALGSSWLSSPSTMIVAAVPMTSSFW